MLRALYRRGRGWLRRFAADQRGGILAETGILLPVITLIILSGTEIGRFTLLQQKLNRAAVTMSDLIAQTDSNISLTQVANLYEAAGFVMRPFDLTNNGVIIVSSVVRTSGNPPTVNWQCVGAGGLAATSQLGTAGSTATLPTGFILRDGESAIFAEVVYAYEPFVAPDLIGSTTLRHESMFRPRFGALAALAPGAVPPGAPNCS